MKRTSIVFFISFLFLIIMSACKEYQYMDWELLNNNWYNIHKNDSGFITTPSGLCYKVIHQGYQRKPNINSIIDVNYKGTLIDGSVFDSIATGTTVQLQLSSSIKGWIEGIPKMNGGGNYIFYIPSKLGYDTATTNTAIPPHSVLRFNVHLVDSYN